MAEYGIPASASARVDDKHIVKDNQGRISLDPDFSSQLFGFMNNSAGTDERQDLELSISEWNHDDGFVDVLWDQSKVASKTGIAVTEGQNNSGNGYAEIAKTALGTSEATTNNNTGSGAISWSMDININGSAIVEKLGAGAGVSGYDCTISVRDSSGNVLASKTVSSGSDVEATFSVSDYSRIPEDETLTLKFSSADINTYYDSATYSGTIWSTASGRLPARYGSPSIKVTETNYASSATLKHSRKDLGFTPQAIQADPDIVLNGQTADLLIHDNSGNTVTIPPSDFGTEVDVSTKLADGNLQPEWSLGSDGSASPKINKTLFTGVQ